MELMRLRGRKICERVLQKGYVWKGKTFLVRYIPGPPPHPSVHPGRSALYVGTVVSRKLEKSAVKRNRMRRRVREALRVTLRDSPPLKTSQLLLSPRSASLNAPFTEMLSDMRSFLVHLLP